MLDLIAYIIVRLLNLLSNLIPVSVSLWFGRQIGKLIFFFNKKRRMIAYANLKAAFAKEKEPRELRGILSRVYQNIAQTFVEILNLTKVSPKYVERYVEIVNLERVRNAVKSGRGVILLTAHFGDWEMSSLVGAIIGFPMTVLAREQKMKRLNELLNRLRESKGCKVVRKGISIKFILRALRNKEIVGMLSDQDAGKNGVFVNFFGRPTSTAPGAFEFSKRTGAILLPNFITRTRGPYHKVFLEEYIDTSLSDISSSVQAYMSLLESYVRRYPDQWLWLHKRWKSTPARSIVILNDGRAGHLNQSLAVANEIRRARQSQGAPSDDTKVSVIDVKFKSPFSRFLLSAAANFSSWRCHGCMRCLRRCLEKESYDSLMRAYADFVISCGSGLAPVNSFLAIENNARNIVIMKPGGVSLSKFSLAIVPRHDNVRMRENVILTDMAPNLMDPERMRRAGEALRGSLGLTGNRVVGVLIGGDNPDYALTDDIANKAIDEISKAALELDAELLVTTSRRTPGAVERILKERLLRHPRCRLLVIANEKNMDEAVSGILYLSDVVVVSGESVSMVSEAASSGKTTVAFNLAKRNPGITKHERALRNMEALGYIRVADPIDLGRAITALSPKGPAGKPKDMNIIYEAVRRLV